MKTKPLISFLLIAFMFGACEKTDDPSISTMQSNATETSTVNPTFISPESAYTSFLNELYSGDEELRNIYENDRDHYSDGDWNDMEFEYALKDLDNDGIPELTILNNLMNVAIYTFNDGLAKKIGSQRFGTGTTRLFFSDNPAYAGIFYFFVGGGLEHYGYMNVKDNQLFVEELWNEDYSGWRENRIEELSDDKGLVNESKIVYSENNDIDWNAADV